MEDVDGAIRCIQWPTEHAIQGELVQPDVIFVVQGTIDRRGGDEANLIIERIIPLDELDQSLTKGIKLRIDQVNHPEDTIKKTYEIVRAYPGSGILELELALEDGCRVHLKSNKVKLDINEELSDRLRELLGKGSVEMLVDSKRLTKPAPKKKWAGRN